MVDAVTDADGAPGVISSNSGPASGAGMNWAGVSEAGVGTSPVALGCGVPSRASSAAGNGLGGSVAPGRWAD